MFRALRGVGAPGNIIEWTGRAYHLRRRLSKDEMNLVGPVIDIRGTGEAYLRLLRVKRWLPAGWTE